MLVELPPELVDIILGFIVSLKHGSDDAVDRVTLSVCGQVCRYWAGICRAILFQSITLRSASDLSAFVTILHHSSLPLLPSVAEIVTSLYPHEVAQDEAENLSPP